MSDQINAKRQSLDHFFEQQEIAPVTLSDYDKKKQENRAFLQHNSIERTKEEIKFIDRMLSDSLLEDMDMPENLKFKLTSSDTMALANRKSLDLANILLNSDTKSNSEEMTDVKIDILNLSKVLEANRNMPLTAESMDNVESAICMAIDSCRNYVNNRHPKLKAGKARKNTVKELLTNLLFESQMFLACRKYLKPAEGEVVPASIGELFFGKKQDNAQRIERPLAKNEVYGAERRPVFAEKTKKAATFFAPNYSFADAIKRKYSKASDRKKQARKVRELYDALKRFTPGHVELAEVNIMGQTVKLLQRSDGSAYIIDDHREYPLGKSLATICMQIENEIFYQPEVYGNEQITSLVDFFENPDYLKNISAGEHNRVRTMLISYLAKQTGLVENDFNNTFKKDLVKYIRQIIKGTKTPTQVRDEVIEHSKSGVFVNGVAISEMVLLNKNKSIDQIAQMVKMKTEVEEEIIEPGWTKEQQQVKNMIADLIFTTDTEKMDLSIASPGEFVKDILTKHKDAMKALVASKGNGEDMVTEILKKMSIADLDGDIDGTKVALSKVVADSINSLRDLYASSENGEIKAEDLVAAKKKLDTVVDQSCRILQSNVDVMIGAIFPEKAEKQNKSLKELVEDTMKTDKGQGKFIRNVLSTYFDKVNNVDKRAMLASLFRTAKTVPELNATDIDLIEEIKELNLAKHADKFQHTHKDKFGEIVYDLTDADKAALAEYRAEKQKLRIQSNFMSGLLRGAGPLLHKIMQGLPAKGLPEEIQQALSDVKSKLPPIPDSVVQAELLAMVESSGGNITRIEKIKSLGAASVGQTFLCKVYGPSKDMVNGKELVIKLLRPDAKNRMQREEDVMLKAAQDTDEAMYLTYKGQLENYKKELDLSIEGNNCKLGIQYYKDKFADVKTMQVYEGVSATSTSLVLEKAEGVTLNSYIEELATFRDKTLKDLYVRRELQDGRIKIIKQINHQTSKDFETTIINKKKQLLDKIDEAVKRRDHLINLCNVWIDEAIMTQKGGMYHGDLHSGNIMINDDNATFIDYGNTVELNATQQKCIGQMTVAAAASIFNKASHNSLDLFFEGFDGLLKENNDPEFLSMYNDAKKQELKTEFGKILHMGDENEAGLRISLCLARAQELGVKLPPAVANFSQGQIRLQNSINEMNTAIESIKKGIKWIDNMQISANILADPVKATLHKVENSLEEGTIAQKYNRIQDTLLPVDEQTFKQDLLDNTYKEADLEKGIAEVDKRSDFKKKYTDNYIGIIDGFEKKELLTMGMNPELIKKVGFKLEEGDVGKYKSVRQTMREFFDTWKDKKGTPEHKEAIGKAVSACYLGTMDALESFGGATYINELILNAFKNLDWSSAEIVLEIYEKHVPKAVELLTDIQKLWEEQSAKKKMDEKRKEALADKIFKEYNDLHTALSGYNSLFTGLSVRMDVPEQEDFMEEDLRIVFDIQQDNLGAAIKQKYEEYKAIKKKYPIIVRDNNNKSWKVGEEDAENYAKVKSEFLDLYKKAAVIRISEFGKAMFSKNPNIKVVDFSTVMRDVMAKRFPTSTMGAKLSSGIALNKWLGTKALSAVMEMN